MWYVIWVATGSEHKIADTIRASFEAPCEFFNDCWVPMHLERRKRGGVYSTVSRVLFPGYVFVDTADPERFHKALRNIHTPDMSKSFLKILSNDRLYLSISPKEEEVIKRLTSNSLDKKTMGISTAVVRDGVLSVLDGPLKGFEQYIVSVDRHKHKCRLAMTLFGEERTITAGIAVVEGVLPGGKVN